MLQKFIQPRRLFLKLFLLFEIIFSVPTNSFSQNNSKVLIDDWSIGIKVGSNYFLGDLSSHYRFFSFFNPNFKNGVTMGGFVSKRINNTFTATLDGDFTKLHDTGSSYYHEYFKADIAQINFSVDADLFYGFFNVSSRFKILPYLGVGLTFYHSSVYDLTTNLLVRDTSYDSVVGLSSLNTHKDMAFNIPFGLKLTQRFGNTLEIGADFRINNTLTDKLDATVGGDNSSIYKGGLKLDMIPDNTWYDAWGYLGLTVSYKIQPTQKNYIKSSRYL
jgi:OOP family OmpA-OmpF porin